jgi:hypothetical protein
MTILETLRGRIQQRQMNATDTIATAARAAASGASCDVGAVEKALEQSGQSATDFEAAVEQARRRVAWLADFDKGNSATSKIKKLETAATAERTKFEAARAAFLSRAEAIDAELRTLREVHDRGQRAQENLLDARGVPGTLGERYREAVEELDAANVAVGDANRALREINDRARSEQRWIDQLTGEQAQQVKPDRIFLRGNEPTGGESHRIEEHRTALARAQRRKVEAEAVLTEAEKNADRARRAVDALLPEVLKN